MAIACLPMRRTKTLCQEFAYVRDDHHSLPGRKRANFDRSTAWPFPCTAAKRSPSSTITGTCALRVAGKVWYAGLITITTLGALWAAQGRQTELNAIDGAGLLLHHVCFITTQCVTREKLSCMKDQRIYDAGKVVDCWPELAMSQQIIPTSVLKNT